MKTAKRPAVLRDSWRRPQGRLAVSSRSRWLRRFGFTALTFGLIALLYFLLFGPFFHPTPHLVFATGASPGSSSVPPLAFVQEDFHAVRAPFAGALWLHGAARRESDLRLLASPDDLAPVLERFRGRRTSRDVLIVYLAAHGIARDGEAALLCGDFDPHTADAGVYPVAKLMQQLRACSAGAKLLLLDSGRVAYDPRLGMIVNEFPRLLERAVRQTDDARMWVLHSHAPLEHSHVARRQRQSVFGRAVARGLAGEANRDEDRTLSLGEFARFVQTVVTQQVRDESGGRATQSPQLLRGGDDPLVPDDPVLLPIAPPVVKEPTEQAEPSSQTDQAESATPDSSSADPPPPPADAAPDPHALPAVLQPGPAPKLDAILPLAWQTRDALERRPTTASVPAEYAPHLWRVVVESLLAADEASGAGAIIDTDELGARLRNEARALHALAYGDTAAIERSDPVWRSIADAARLRMPDGATSFALAERFAESGGPAPSDEVRAAAAAWSEALNQDTAEAATELLAKLPGSLVERFVELWWTRRLLAAGSIDWQRVRHALACVRAGEAIAADELALLASFRDRADEADALRLAALRGLVEQLGHDWPERSDRLLDRTLAQYRALAADLAELRAARRLQRELRWRAPLYVRWHQATLAHPALAPAYDDVARLLEQLAELDAVLADESRVAADWPAVLSLTRELRALGKRLDQPVNDLARLRLVTDAASPGADERLATLLGSPLLSADARALLQSFASQRWAEAKDGTVAEPEATPEIAPTPEIPPTLAEPLPLAPADWEPLRRQLALEVRLARLAAPTPEPIAAAQAAEAAYDEEREWLRFRSFGTALAQFYAALPARIDEAARAGQDLSDPASRAERRRRLRDADLALALVDARDARQVASAPGPREREAAAYDLFLRQRERWAAARDDAPADELRFLTAAMSRCRVAAAELAAQPDVSADQVATLSVTGAAELSLAVDPRRETTVTVRYSGAARAPVWLLLRYDPATLTVRPRPAEGVWAAHELAPELARRAAAAREAAELAAGRARGVAPDEEAGDPAELARRRERATWYPPRPDEAGLAATMEMGPGESRTFTLDIQRSTAAGRSTRLIVSAVAGTGVSHSYPRHEIAVELPPVESFRVVPEGPPGGATEANDALVLHPWPNRATDYRFALANDGPADKKVTVELLGLTQPSAVSLPSWLLPATAADDLLRQHGPAVSLSRIEDLTLPTGGRPVSLPWPNVSLKPDASEAPAAEPDDAAPGPAPAAAKPPEGPPPPSVRFGLLFVVRDKETGRVALRRVDFRPQRPRRYVRASVGYDAVREQIRIRIAPRRSDGGAAGESRVVPPSGIRVQCQFARPLPRGTESQLTGLLRRDDDVVELYAQVPREEQRTETFYLHVDGYPRAFVFRVPCLEASSELPEVKDELAVRVTSPAPLRAFAAPAERVAVRFEVDAPAGAFESRRDWIDVGLDRDRDREFRDEPTLRLHSDRQAEVRLAGFGPAGQVRFGTEVGDFAVEVPAGGASNLRANVLARVQAGDAWRWSEPVEVVLDGTGPRIDSVVVRPDRDVVAGAELEVVVTADDGGLAGVEKVEAGFDVERKGRFAPSAPAVPAARLPDGGWLAKVPATAPPGPITLLVRATDAAGNAGDFAKLPVRVLSKEEAEAAQKSATNRVTGVVRYGGVALPGAEVTLEGGEPVKRLGPELTDDRGAFTFPAVPPGAYKLKARGLTKNRPRIAERQITVDPPPARLQRIELDAK